MTLLNEVFGLSQRKRLKLDDKQQKSLAHMFELVGEHATAASEALYGGDVKAFKEAADHAQMHMDEIQRFLHKYVE